MDLTKLSEPRRGRVGAGVAQRAPRPGAGGALAQAP